MKAARRRLIFFRITHAQFVIFYVKIASNIAICDGFWEGKNFFTAPSAPTLFRLPTPISWHRDTLASTEKTPPSFRNGKQLGGFSVGRGGGVLQPNSPDPYKNQLRDRTHVPSPVQPRTENSAAEGLETACPKECGLWCRFRSTIPRSN